MNAKIVSVLLTALFITGCSCKEEVIYVDRITTVNLPVKCNVPTVPCTFHGTTDEVMGQLIGCIHEHREAAKVCQ